MKSATSLASNQHPSPQKKPNTSSASGMLTNSEFEHLQQRKRELNDYARKAFASKK